MSDYIYQVGGSLPSCASSYVVREADRALYTALRKGELCHVLSSHQAGKSSLRVRVTQQLQNNKIACGWIDLSRLDTPNSTPSQWYADVINALVRNFRLHPQFDVTRWWQTQAKDSPINCLEAFLEGALPALIKRPIVIFIDEINSVLSLPFKANDFWGVIQSCQHRVPRLTFVLSGTASLPILTDDQDQNSWVKSCVIELQDFQFYEAQALQQGLVDKVDHPEMIFATVFDWTGGQPFLTQKLCQLIVEAHQEDRPINSVDDVNLLVRQKILSNWVVEDEPSHLRTIRDRLLKNPRRTEQILEIYQHILHGDFASKPYPLASLCHEAYPELWLSGLVVQDRGSLRVRNRIYEAVFDCKWIAMQRAAYRDRSQV